MRNLLIGLGFSIGVFLFSTDAVTAKQIQKLKLPEPLSGRILDVVEATEGLQKAFFNQDQAAMKAQPQKLIQSIDKAMEVTAAAKEQGPHIRKILEAAKSQLVNLGEATGDEQKKQFLQESFRQLIIFARNYELSKNFNIFFCPSDKSFWLQSGNKPQNPVNPVGRLARCGSVMK